MPELAKYGLTMIETCSISPEQHDVMLGNTQVGYLRLRHGSFTVSCPNGGNLIIYEADPEGDGSFEEHEREKYLCEAIDAILLWLVDHWGEVHA